MFCPNCGTLNEDQACFCGACGTKLMEQQTPCQQPVVQQKPEQQSYYQVQSWPAQPRWQMPRADKVPGRGLGIAGLVLGVVSVVFGMVWVLSAICGVLAVIFSVWISLWSVVISLYATAVALAASAVGCILGSFFMIGDGAGILMAAFGAAFVCAGLSILLFILSNLAAKGMMKLTKLTWNGLKNIFTGKEKAA